MATRLNQITNPGCETNTTGWTGVNGAVISSSADRAWVGTKSQKVVYDGTARAAEQTGTSVAAHVFTYNGISTFSAYVWVPTGSPAVKIKIAGPFYNVSGSVSTLNDQWERLSVTTSVSTGLSGYLYLLNNTTSVPNATAFYADGGLMELGTLGAAFDGDTADTGSVQYDWLGTAHASQSVATDVVTGAIVWDAFNRANNASVLGNPNTGPAPIIQTGTWGISGTQAYTPSTGSNGSIVVWECSTANVDITVKRTTSSTVGGIVFGLIGTLDFWYAYFNSGQASNDESYIGRFTTTSGSLWDVFKGKNGSFITTASVLRFIHYNGWIEMWADSTLILRGFLPEPVTATKHGIRTTSGNHTFDDLVIMAAPDITMPVKTGEVRELTFGTNATNIKDSFVYRGRDTKDQDTTGVS
jgi:hypothetical protein